jgi:DHA3 family macrolide efflux protein-like MFS transporter
MESSPKNFYWKRKAIAFITGQAITLFGSSLVQMAIIWYVTLKTSSGVWVTALTLSSLVPQLLISLFAGVWADRYDRKKLIIIADSLIAVATLILAVFFILDKLGNLELLAIILVSIIRSFGSGIQSPAVSAVIPQLVPEEKLSRFNGINGSVQSLIQFTSPAAAGALMSAGPFHYILLIDVLTAVIGTSVLAFIKIPNRPNSEKAGDAAFFSEMKASITYSIRHKLIGRLLLIYGAFIFLSVPSGFLTTLLIQRTFGENYVYLSVNETFGFAGMVLGGLLIGGWGGFKNRNKTLMFGILFYGVFAFALGLSNHFWLFALMLFIMCLAIPITQTSVITLLQEKVPPDMMGRIFSLLNIIFNGFLQLGMLLFGPLADAFPIRLLMSITGIMLVFLAVSIPFQKTFYRLGSSEKVPTE